MLDIKIFEFNMFPVNCYLLSDSETGEAVVIDPGCFFEEEKKELKDYIDSHSLKLTHLLCTHLHLDHVFGCHFVEDTFGTCIEASREDEQMLPQIPEYARMFGFRFEDDSMRVGKGLADGDVVKFGKYEIKVIAVPGHSRGGLAFLIEGAELRNGSVVDVVFVGDTLFAGGVGRTDLPGGDSQALFDSIRKRLYTLPDSTVVYSGHGPSTTIGTEKKENLYVR